MSSYAQHRMPGRRPDGRHHPIRRVEEEAQLLLEVERAGESAETPLIAIAMILMVLAPIGATMMLLAFGAAWLFG